MAGHLILLAYVWLQALTAPAGVRVSGTVVPDPPRANVPTRVVLVRGETILTARMESDRTFVFTSVTPGTYDAYVDDVGMSRGTLLGTGMPPTKLVVGPDGAIGVRIEAPRRIVVQGRTSVEGSGLVPSFRVSFTNTRPGARPVTDNVGYAGSIYTQLYEGTYRVDVVGLPAGYIVRTLIADTIDLRTQSLTVTAAEPRTVSVGLALDPAIRSPLVKISGRLTGASPSTYAQTRLSLTSPVLAVGLSAAVSADGTFSIPQALPGTYAVRYSGRRPITGDPAISLGVGASDLTNVELPMPVWKEVSGRIEAPSGAELPKFVGFSAIFPNGAALSADGAARDIDRKLAPGEIVVTPLGHLSISAQVQSNGRFTVNLPIGERQFKLNDRSVPAGTVLKSATYGTADLLKEAFRVTASGTEELVLTFVPRSLREAR